MLGFRLGDEDFTVRVHEGVLEADRGRAEAPDARITGSPEAVAGAVYGDPAALDSADLFIEGDRGAFRVFAGFFELPPKAT